MSEQDEQRPLTRRERRMRELGETGAMDLTEAVTGTAAPAAVEPEPAFETPATTQASVPNAPIGSAPAAQAEPATGDIEISPVNPDGTPRSRRELRQLREAALAERAAAQSENASSAAPAQVDAAVPTAPVEPQPAAAEEPAVSDASAAAEIAEPAAAGGESGTDSAQSVDAAATPSAAPEVDFDSLISPPTEPFTVEELREAESGANAPAEDLLPSGEPAQPAADEPEAAAESAAAPAGEPAKSKRRFPWQRAKADEAESTPEGVPADSADVAPADPVHPASEAPAESDPEASAVSETEAENAAVRGSDVPAASPVDAAAPTAVIDSDAVRAVSDEAPATISEVVPPREPADDLPVVPAAETVALPTQTAAVAPKQPESDAAPSNPEQKSSYSFPDIAPPEEWRSVFDDPASRQFPTPGAQPGGDFDDLISRAVAQEGSTGGTGTSALILPTMPEDTGGLTGPLGATGDLYVTGSLHLPKSLGETGGHSAIHDSIEMDPITGDQISESSGDGSGPAPVSARHAVSARVDSGMPVVAKPAREKSKLPLILSLTGGGLLIVVVALGAWGASNGFFG